MTMAYKGDTTPLLTIEKRATETVPQFMLRQLTDLQKYDRVLSPLLRGQFERGLKLYDTSPSDGHLLTIWSNIYKDIGAQDFYTTIMHGVHDQMQQFSVSPLDGKVIVQAAKNRVGTFDNCKSEAMRLAVERDDVDKFNDSHSDYALSEPSCCAVM